MHPTRIIIFDGGGQLSAGLVEFINRHGRKAAFMFVPAPSATGGALPSQWGINALESNALILIKNGQAFTRSDAVVEIARDLKGIWKLGVLFKIIPRRVRETLYAFVTAHRRRWQGRKAGQRALAETAGAACRNLLCNGGTASANPQK
jgi:predicted DCC family thiol-disulfide oxidoreductase YuxK